MAKAEFDFQAFKACFQKSLKLEDTDIAMGVHDAEQGSFAHSHKPGLRIEVSHAEELKTAVASKKTRNRRATQQVVLRDQVLQLQANGMLSVP